MFLAGDDERDKVGYTSLKDSHGIHYLTLAHLHMQHSHIPPLLCPCISQQKPILGLYLAIHAPALPKFYSKLILATPHSHACVTGCCDRLEE